MHFSTRGLKMNDFAATYVLNHHPEVRPILFWHKFWCVTLRWTHNMGKSWKLAQSLTSCTFWGGHNIRYWLLFLIGDDLLMMCVKFHWKYRCRMGPNQRMKKHMFRSCITIALALHTQTNAIVLQDVHILLFMLFYSLIWAHSTAIFPMKFHTHHQKVIPNQKQQSNIRYYIPPRRCMTLNFKLIFMIFPYYVFIEAWRIKICTRMESGEPPDDDYVRNLQRNHSCWGHEWENAFLDFCAQWSVKS